MTLGIMQPYFLPYIGYWQLLGAVDKYVVYDDVNYIMRGWINRNNFLVGGKAAMLSIALQGASQNKKINEIEIADDFRKFRKSIEMSYAKAPCFKETTLLLDNILGYASKNLAEFLSHSIRQVAGYLNLKTDILISSDIEKDNSLKGQDKILHICKQLGASTYINAIGGQELYNPEVFASNNIKLKFLRTKPISYPQFKNDFIPNLSILDVLMFNSKEQVKAMLQEYELV
jgi:hypothetical protein